MAHEKTIAAFKNAGYDWTVWHEKGYEAHNREIKPVIDKDPNKTVKVNSVYRKRVEDETDASKLLEVITWDQITIAHTPLGNPIELNETANDLCFWLEPTTKQQVRYNPETEERETITVPGDFSEVKKHYLYPFNKENIAMIKKITSNNSRKCNWYVEDENMKSRSVNNFEDWSTKTFNELMYPPRLFVRRLADTDPTQTADQQQYH
jgi:hypothetical protein